MGSVWKQRQKCQVLEFLPSKRKGFSQTSARDLSIGFRKILLFLEAESTAVQGLSYRWSQILGRTRQARKCSLKLRLQGLLKVVE